MKKIMCLLTCVLVLTGCSLRSNLPPKQLVNTRWKGISPVDPTITAVYLFNEDATEIIEERSQTPMYVFKDGYYHNVYIGSGGTRTISNEPKISAEVTDEGELLLTMVYDDGTTYQKKLVPLLE